jgi:3-oxoacyl-[acyl-carrier protein] reductase
VDLGLKGRVAILCAASQGLGKAAAMGFAEEGSHVVICARDKRRLLHAAKEISQAARKQKVIVVPVVADVTRLKDIRKLVLTAVREFGRIDILVTNSGGPPVATFPELSDENWEAGITLNLMSTIRCIREALPHMQKRKWGRIINMTSFTAKQPANDLVISSTVRPGILGLAKVLANQYAKDGITINNVVPGYSLTARQLEISTARAKQKGVTVARYMAELAREVPAGRYGRPEEIANVIVFLGSMKASYINGATLTVDGGFVKGLF